MLPVIRMTRESGEVSLYDDVLALPCALMISCLQQLHSTDDATDAPAEHVHSAQLTFYLISRYSLPFFIGSEYVKMHCRLKMAAD